MSVTINYHGIRATCEGQEWNSDNADVAMFLNALRIDELPTSDPFPDYTLAQQIVARFGATIVDIQQPPNVPGRVY